MVLATKKDCQRVLAASLRVVSAITGNPPLGLGLATYTIISTVHKYQRFSADLATAVSSLVVRALD